MTQPKNSIESTIAWLLNNKFMSDVKFEFGVDFEGTGNKLEVRVLFAHSLILGARSPIFEWQFEKENPVTIPITDITYAGFYEFLSFIYTDNCKITRENVDEILKLAQDHTIAALEEKCVRYMLQNSFPVKKVLKILTSELVAENSEDFTNFARQYTREILNDTQFKKISRNALDIILKLDQTDILETEIFCGAIKWAYHACTKLQIQPNSKHKRTVLGDALKLIRFPIMTAYEFGRCIAEEHELLTTEEIGAILMEITGDDKNTLGFSGKKRDIKSLPEIEKVVLNNTCESSYVIVPTPAERNSCKVETKIYQLELKSISNELKYAYSPFETTFKVDTPIILHKIQLSYSTVNQECRIEIIDNNEIIIFASNYQTFAKLSSNCEFKCNHIDLTPEIFYTIKVNFSYPGEFLCNDKKKMPHIIHTDNAQFQFNKLSLIVNRIYYSLKDE